MWNWHQVIYYCKQYYFVIFFLHCLAVFFGGGWGLGKLFVCEVSGLVFMLLMFSFFGLYCVSNVLFVSFVVILELSILDLHKSRF